MRQLKIGWLRRQRLMFGMMAKRPVPQTIFDSWVETALTDKAVRRDLVKYCRTKFRDDELIKSTEHLAAFDRPALVLWTDNPVMPADHGRRLAELLPQGRLKTIDDAYVLVMLDQPVQTAQAIGQFLAVTAAR